LERRCLIPASGYYEWKSEGSQKVKYQIFAPGQMVYLAACYRQEQESEKQVSLPRFVILTQAAAPQLASIHDRMPVLFTADSANRWLEEGPAALEQSYQDLSYQVA
jgi:putative SOS response-associated peptidase YedK